MLRISFAEREYKTTEVILLSLIFALKENVRRKRDSLLAAKTDKRECQSYSDSWQGCFFEKREYFLSSADSQGEALPVPPAGPKIRRGDFLKKLRCNY